MKDRLFEMLLTLFENSLNQLQKDALAIDAIDEIIDEDIDESSQFQRFKKQSATATRVLTYDEQLKLTKASYQFLMRMKVLNILKPQDFEMVMDQLMASDTEIISLPETKWTIKNVLSSTLDENQLTFLNLILYHAEEEMILH